MHPPTPYRVSPSDAGTPLRQGEILTGVPQFRLNVSSIGTADFGGQPFVHPYAVVLTQDCDLEQDHRVRGAGKPSDKLIPSVLLCEVATAVELFGIIRQTNKKLWDRISINKDDRYHFLQRVEVGCDVAVHSVKVPFPQQAELAKNRVWTRSSNSRKMYAPGKSMPSGSSI